jgi:uncharacterized protein
MQSATEAQVMEAYKTSGAGHGRKGNWMQTFTGRAYWPIDPRPEDVSIHDIAHALSNLCRYTGHCNKFYSVAEHSVLVSRLVPKEHALIGLMHDATEAYVNDIARPLKPSLQNYQEIEHLNWLAICTRFGLNPELPSVVKDIDTALCLTEKAALMGPAPLPWGIDLTPPKIEVTGWSPHVAKRSFLSRFRVLTSGLSMVCV